MEDPETLEEDVVLTEIIKDESEWDKTEEPTHDIDTNNPKDRLTRVENECLQELRKHYCTKGLSDKRVCYFMFGRKLNLKRTVELIKANLQWRKDNGYYDRNVKFSELNPKIVETNYSYMIPEGRDLQGRAVIYLTPGRLMMGSFSLKEILDFAIWQTDTMFQIESLDFYRHGVVCIEDISGMSLKNMDRKANVAFKEMNNVFPNRIKGIYIVNPTKLLSILIKIARFFVKAKVIARVKTVQMAELTQYVEADKLSKEYGGNAEFPGCAALARMAGEEF